MSVRIAGMGWVTPLGSDLEGVWQRLERGDWAETKEIANPETGRLHRCIRVPPKLVDHLGRNPRLRRSSPISYFAVAAALNALENAGLAITPATAARIAIVFAVTDGSVVYTRKFYDQIVKQGANAASPLLFPETVYNAPASHLADQLGVDGITYTLVGDGATGLAAVQMAEDLLALEQADHCIVVACEELDWILCEAYRTWRLTRTPLAEGAAALVLTRDQGRLSVRASGAIPFFRQRDAAAALEKAAGFMGPVGPVDFIVTCEEGSFRGRAVAAALQRILRAPSQPASQTQAAFGEMLAAGSLVNLIVAALRLEKEGGRRALIPAIGFNYQAAAAMIERP